MVLDGLEENVDFWKMVLSDDDEVPIPGLTLNHSSKRAQLCRAHPANMNADNAAEGGQGATVAFGSLERDRAEKERSLARPEKLPNGKNRCVLVTLHLQTSDCTPPGATIPARINPPAAICGVLHSIPHLLTLT
jgi:hypothetical protein